MSLARALRARLSTTAAPTRPSPSPSPSPLQLLRQIQRAGARRYESTRPNPPGSQAPPPPPPPPGPSASALDRIARLLPKRLRPHLARFRAAPLSHATAFLLIHEATALAPLVGLTALFHYRDIVPTNYVLGPWAGYAEEGVNTVLRYVKRKGWFGLGAEDTDGDRAAEERLEAQIKGDAERARGEQGGGQVGGKGGDKGGSWWAFWRKAAPVDDGADDGGPQSKSKTARAVGLIKDKVTLDNTSNGYKIGVQLAAAYAITKALLFPRILLSLWLTPPVARGMVWARKAVFKR